MPEESPHPEPSTSEPNLQNVEVTTVPKKKPRKKTAKKVTAKTAKKAAKPKVEKTKPLPEEPKKEVTISKKVTAKKVAKKLPKKVQAEDNTSEEPEKKEHSSEKPTTEQNQPNQPNQQSQQRRGRNRNRGRQANQQEEQKITVDAKLVTKRAWKIFAGEVSEEGLALIADKDARELSRRSLRTAEIFTREEAIHLQRSKKQSESNTNEEK